MATSASKPPVDPGPYTATGATRFLSSLIDSNRYSILLTSKELMRD
jgi:hypothetical protein